MNFNLALPFCEHARSDPRNLALHVAGNSYSYGELATLTGAAAANLADARTVAVLASRSLGAYVGVLAAGWPTGRPPTAMSGSNCKPAQGINAAKAMFPKTLCRQHSRECTYTAAQTNNSKQKKKK